MKSEFIEMIGTAFLKGLNISGESLPEILIEIPKRVEHGDFSCSAAMIYGSKNKTNPRRVAQLLIDNMPENILVESVEIAGPGFLNFRMKKSFWYNSLTKMIQADKGFGKSDEGNGKKVQVEFVSANPTGPLHIGHGRGAAVGDSMANIMRFAGYTVEKEYYINDVGNQISVLGDSVIARIKEITDGVEVDLEGFYKGDYVKDIAKTVIGELENADDREQVVGLSKKLMLDDIKDDLKAFNIVFDNWFSEASLHKGETNQVDDTLEFLKEKGCTYISEDALWVRTTDIDDDKDRVAVRSNGEKTYFASDIAYHKNKHDRGFDTIINVWGADHHGYIKRVEAVCEMMGYNNDLLKILIVQLVHLFRDGKQVVMSKRGGEFITLREVVDEVGCDAARFFFLMRRADSSLDFDLDLAKQESSENPVYYVQYAFARICSLMKKATESDISLPDLNSVNLERLNLPEEIALIKLMTLFPQVVSLSVSHYEPHRVCYYLIDLASTLHGYYYKNRVITDDPELTKAKLLLMQLIGNILKNGLEMIGVKAPEKM